VKSALLWIGRRNSRPSRLDDRRLMCHRGGGDRPRAVERNQEQSRMVRPEYRSARDGQRAHRVARAPRLVRPNLAMRRVRGMSLISASMPRSSR
jgi:hypothetical protein